MVIERFSQSIVNSGIFRVYVATGFFATLIFFVLNSELYTPLEMIFGVIAATILLKGLANLMLSLIILLFKLDNKQRELEFKYQSENIDSLMSELSVQDAETSLKADKKGA